jgi:hypothetical protein
MRFANSLGMGISRVEERFLCAFGLLGAAPVQFESCQTIPFGGVLLLLPFLLECGLLSYRNHYSQRLKGFYNFDNLFIIIAFIYLCRIKSFEGIKKVSPGETGKLVGYDRIPEVKTLRAMVGEITAQKSAEQWGAALSQSWISDEQPQLYYIDGHVQVYHGYLANLGKKHVSRQRLCLPGMMEFWVNASDGNPYFFVTARVNEKMGEMLDSDIIPELLKLHPVSDEQKKRMDENPEEPVFTLVFDREAWSPAFFAKLWNDHRIAVITYRKNVKDKWDESLFEEYIVATTFDKVQMKLHEQPLMHGDFAMREVRKLSPDGHQTSIVSTNKILIIEQIASNMFARWAQENFFRYMRQDFSLDKIVKYSIDEIDGDVKVVNREYSNLCYQIKKEREKLARREAKMYQLDEKNPIQEDEKSEKENAKWLKQKLELVEQIGQLKEEIENLIQKRKKIPYKIPVSQMPESSRYNRLNQESKTLQNIIKMICYRAETSLAGLLSPHYKRANQEIRMLIKTIINTPIDMEVDHEKYEIRICLYTLSNQRSNEAVSKICEAVNATNTVYPGTNFRLFFKTATS